MSNEKELVPDDGSCNSEDRLGGILQKVGETEAVSDNDDNDDDRISSFDVGDNNTLRSTNTTISKTAHENNDNNNQYITDLTSVGGMSRKSSRSHDVSKDEIVVLPSGKKVRRVKRSVAKKYRDSSTNSVKEGDASVATNRSSKSKKKLPVLFISKPNDDNEERKNGNNEKNEELTISEDMIESNTHNEHHQVLSSDADVVEEGGESDSDDSLHGKIGDSLARFRNVVNTRHHVQEVKSTLSDDNDYLAKISQNADADMENSSDKANDDENMEVEDSFSEVPSQVPHQSMNDMMDMIHSEDPVVSNPIKHKHNNHGILDSIHNKKKSANNQDQKFAENDSSRRNNNFSSVSAKENLPTYSKFLLGSDEGTTSPAGSSVSNVGSSTTSASSMFGPVWKQAKLIAKLEAEKKQEEEEEIEEKFQQIRSRAPAKINVTNQADNIKKLRQKQESTMQKQTKFSRSLLAKTMGHKSKGGGGDHHHHHAKSSSVTSDVDIAPTLFRAAEEAVACESDGESSSQSDDESRRGGGANTNNNYVHVAMDNGGGVMPIKIAHRRTRTIQLFIFGIFGVIFGFFGCIYTQFTCGFIHANIIVGDDENVMKLHFGMWKHTPYDAVFDNYSYCNGYEEDDFYENAPSLIRILVSCSLLTGSFSLCVLWTYLMMGITSELFWKLGVRTLLVAGIAQSSSFFIFAGEICEENECSFGPGAIVSVFTTLIWFLIAYEMHYNTPTLALLPTLMANAYNAPLIDLEWNEVGKHAKQMKLFNHDGDVGNKAPLHPSHPPANLNKLGQKNMKQNMGRMRARAPYYSYDDDDYSSESESEDGYTEYTSDPDSEIGYRPPLL